MPIVFHFFDYVTTTIDKPAKRSGKLENRADLPVENR
jgi:hypothetical protein